MVDERETSLVIDHAAGVFHITSNRIGLARYLSELAAKYKLAVEQSFGHITVTNVPVKYLSKLRLATLCQTKAKKATGEALDSL